MAQAAPSHAQERSVLLAPARAPSYQDPMRRCLSMNLLLSLAVVACAPPPSKLPTINASDLPKIVWPGVEPRSAALSVTDERKPQPPESEETVRRVHEALVGALAKGKLAVAPDSPNRLSVSFDYPMRVPDGYSPYAECVEARARLEFGTKKAEAWAVGCFEERDIAIAQGADASDSFREALRGAFKGLDRQLKQFQKR